MALKDAPNWMFPGIPPEVVVMASELRQRLGIPHNHVVDIRIDSTIKEPVIAFIVNGVTVKKYTGDGLELPN